MASEFEQVREHLGELDRQLEEVRRRLARLEAGERKLATVSREPFPPPDRATPGSTSRDSSPSWSAIALVGRSLVVLGGAYLFRAISDRALVPAMAGAIAALVYAAFWLWQCDRSAARAERASAVFHGLTATLIACPLIWEAACTFELLAPEAAAGLLVVLLALTLSLAIRRDLTALAWGAVLAHITTALALMPGAEAYEGGALAVLAAAVAMEVPRAGDRWPVLRAVAALAADIAFLVLLGVTLSRGEPSVGGIAVPALLSLPIVYVASAAIRTLVHGRTLSAFDVAQLGVALAVGMGGGVRVQLARGATTLWLGATGAGLGAAAYAAGFSRIARRQGRSGTYHVYAGFGTLLVLVGTALVVGRGAALAGVWALASLVAVALGSRLDRLTLCAHGAAYGIAAAWASGLCAAGVGGLVASLDAWRAVPPAAAVVAGVLFAVAALTLAMRRSEDPWTALLPQAVLVFLLCIVIAGMTARGVAPLALEAVGEGTSPALLAGLRSILLALLAVALAAAGTRWVLQELHWVVVVLLACGAVKLLWEDLRVGEPVELFVALAAFGGALSTTSRFLRRGARVGGVQGDAAG